MRYRIEYADGRGTIIFQKFFKIMSVFVCPSTEYVKGLMKLKEKMIKMQKNITILLHHAKSFDFSNQRTFWNVPSLNLDNWEVHPGSLPGVLP